MILFLKKNFLLYIKPQSTIGIYRVVRFCLFLACSLNHFRHSENISLASILRGIGTQISQHISAEIGRRGETEHIGDADKGEAFVAEQT